MLVSALEAVEVDDEEPVLEELDVDELDDVAGWPGVPRSWAACKKTESALARASAGERNDAYNNSWLSYCWRLKYCASYGEIVLEADGAAADGTGFGAAPVDSNEAPTDDKPPFGNELEPVELEPRELEPNELGPREEMPLISQLYHPGPPGCLGNERP
jgi:hypothetical protein